MKKKLYRLAIYSVLIPIMVGTLPGEGFAQEKVSFEPVAHFGGWLASLAVPETGNYSYLGVGSGFVVVDVSDPTRIRQVTSLPFLDGGDVSGIALKGSTAYLANINGLQTVDISDPLHPTLIGSHDTPGSANYVKIIGTTAYIADGWDGGLQIFDVSDPTNPSSLGSYDTPKNALALDVQEGTAYVADVSSLQIIDVSDPANPTLLSSLSSTETIFSVNVIGTTAYVANGGAGLRVLDVSDPANPTQLGVYDTPSSEPRRAPMANMATSEAMAFGSRIQAIH